MHYKTMINRLKRMEAKTNSNELNLYLIEKIEGIYHIKKSGATDKQILRLQPSEYDEWKQRNDNSKTTLIEIVWADEHVS